MYPFRLEETWEDGRIGQSFSLRISKTVKVLIFMALGRKVGRKRNDFLFRTGILEQLCTKMLLTRLFRSQSCAHLIPIFLVPPRS